VSRRKIGFFGARGWGTYVFEAKIIGFCALNIVIPTKQFNRHTKYSTAHRMFKNRDC